VYIDIILYLVALLYHIRTTKKFFLIPQRFGNLIGSQIAPIYFIVIG